MAVIAELNRIEKLVRFGKSNRIRIFFLNRNALLATFSTSVRSLRLTCSIYRPPFFSNTPLCTTLHKVPVKTATNADSYRQCSDDHSNGVHPCEQLVSWNLYHTVNRTAKEPVNTMKNTRKCTATNTLDPRYNAVIRRRRPYRVIVRTALY